MKILYSIYFRMIVCIYILTPKDGVQYFTIFLETFFTCISFWKSLCWYTNIYLCIYIVYNYSWNPKDPWFWQGSARAMKSIWSSTLAMWLWGMYTYTLVLSLESFVYGANFLNAPVCTDRYWHTSKLIWRNRPRSL